MMTKQTIRIRGQQPRWPTDETDDQQPQKSQQTKVTQISSQTNIKNLHVGKFLQEKRTKNCYLVHTTKRKEKQINKNG